GALVGADSHRFVMNRGVKSADFNPLAIPCAGADADWRITLVRHAGRHSCRPYGLARRAPRSIREAHTCRKRGKAVSCLVPARGRDRSMDSADVERASLPTPRDDPEALWSMRALVRAAAPDQRSGEVRRAGSPALATRSACGGPP